MLFSSTLFLFAFLPVVLSLHFVLRDVRARNALLLVASLFFYAWGEVAYVGVLLASIAGNAAIGRRIDARRGGAGARAALATGVAANLALLGAFKYANFAVDNLNVVLAALGAGAIELPPVHLPIGISFFTFQALTYLIDVHRGDAPVERSPLRVALYIALFPQLIAGPIVRFREIATQLHTRTTGADDFAEGVRRFTIGLAKKVLIANTLALPADRIFAIPQHELGAAVAWFGLVCFAFQIYFDFAGYSDMAIGLGRCFGFRFPENFDWPYTARSLREFWRRWHMSLSRFFRDYLYIPLGGNRHGAARTHANLIAVFLLCGLWHGASWTFVIWGALHGVFLVLERTRFGALLERLPGALASAYTLGVVFLAWVFFRADDLGHASVYLGAMAGAHSPESGAYPLALFVNAKVLCVLAIAALGLLPGRLRDAGAWRARLAAHPRSLGLARYAAIQLLLVLCAMSLAAGTHNPFIYFRF